LILHWRSPLIFAHRGASAHAPENTIAAFELAIQMKADVIELDAKLTADEQVVVIHDQTVDRTTDGSGKVSNMPLAALRELDAGSHFGEKFQYEPIPTLKEVLEVCVGKIFINIELTNYITPFDNLADKVSQLIADFTLENHVLVSSFHPIPLRHFHKLSPSIPIGFLAKLGSAGFLSRSWLGRAIVNYQALHPEKSDVSLNLVKKAHKSGRRIHPFTVNAPEEMAKLFNMGVDGIITDDPALAHQIFDASHSNFYELSI
jgi:glycerophosphoryl diester phosphodiesterase